MACPYFFPLEKIEAGLTPARLPLGHVYRGECHATGEPFVLPQEATRAACNSGYGRGACERFPAESAADAVRFHIECPGDLRVQYIFEKKCWPAGSGWLAYSSAGELLDRAASPVLRRQAEIFLQNYFERQTADGR